MLEELCQYYALLAEYMVQKIVMEKLEDEEFSEDFFAAAAGGTLPLPCPAWRWEKDFLLTFSQKHSDISWWPTSTITGAFALARHLMFSEHMQVLKPRALVKLVGRNKKKRERKQLALALETSIDNSKTRRWEDDAPLADASTLPSPSLYDITQVESLWPWHEDGVLETAESSSSSSDSEEGE